MSRGRRTKTPKLDLRDEICTQLDIPIKPEWETTSGSTVTGDALEAILEGVSDVTGIPPNHFREYEKYVWRLIHKSNDALLLALEIINKPSINYRMESFLFLLLNSWELLLKSKIVDDSRDKNSVIERDSEDKTISFTKCLNILLNENDPIRTNLEKINYLRNEAAHAFINIIPPSALLVSQASILNYNQKLENWFNRSLNDLVPEGMMFLVSEIDPQKFQLTSPLLSKKLSAETIKALNEWENTIDEIVDDLEEDQLGQFIVPLDINLSIVSNPKRADILASLDRVRGEEDAETVVIAKRRVNELSYYCFGLQDIKEKVGLTQPKTLAYINYLDIQSDEKYFKIMKIGKSEFKRYSNKTVLKIREALKETDPIEIWDEYGY